LGPFVLTFFIVLFLLLMQFLWRYIDELVGKGLEIKVIAELMAYASASLVPMALPLAILLSSLMTFGNLGEFYELTALKASGISLQRIMFPLMVLVFIISIGAFFFANYVMPYTNLKMKSLIYDVRQQRPELHIMEGEFFNGIDNYSIRINKKNPVTNIMYNLKIYDHSQRKGNPNVTLADSGKLEMTTDKRNLLITLWHGKSYTEMEGDRKKGYNTYPHRTDIFDEEKIVIALSGYDLQRTDEALFKNYYQMLNIAQLSHATDSLNAEIEVKNNYFKRSLLNYHYFKVREKKSMPVPVAPVTLRTDSLLPSVQKTDTIASFDSLFASFDPNMKRRIVSTALSNARSTQGFIENTSSNLKYEQRNIRKHEIEWHKKFTLAAACLIFLFVGAPLGAIIRKGGMGMPTVISTVLFILYYVFSLIGEKFVRESMLPSYQGMWMSSFALVIVGIFLTYKATNDSSMLNVDTYVSFVRTFLGIDKRNMLDKKIYLSGKFTIIELSRDELRTMLKSLSREAETCKITQRKKIRLQTIVRRLLHPLPDDELKQFIKNYNETVEKIVMSKWLGIKYILDRLHEFPVVGHPDIFHLPVKKSRRIFVLAVFPVFLIYVLLNFIYLHKTISRLEFIRDKAVFLSESLENPSLLIDFEN
jgi:lipopolysaccharide export system permease protein